jgi:hypothetical protein
MMISGLLNKRLINYLFRSLLYMLIEMLTGGLPWKSMERGPAERCKEESEKQLIAMVLREFILILKHLVSLDINAHSDPDFFRRSSITTRSQTTD